MLWTWLLLILIGREYLLDIGNGHCAEGGISYLLFLFELTGHFLTNRRLWERVQIIHPTTICRCLIYWNRISRYIRKILQNLHVFLFLFKFKVVCFGKGEVGTSHFICIIATILRKASRHVHMIHFLLKQIGILFILMRSHHYLWEEFATVLRTSLES
jgi:hypothetical protein